jgi:hypothetical protein
MKTIARRLSIPAILLICLALTQISSSGQQANDPPDSPVAKPGTRFNFEVIESFDAKYLGDTPGHMGRAGGLEKIRPSIALGDYVHRGDDKIGVITTIEWQRVQGSLTIEFDPLPLQRVTVGDKVWIDLNPNPAKAASK